MLFLIAKVSEDLGTLGGQDLGPFGDIKWGVQGNIAGSKLGTAIGSIVGFLTVVAGLYFLIQVVIGGIAWVSSGGDKNGLQQARDKITNGLLGLIIVVAAVSIVTVVGKFLGFDILNPAGFLKAIQFQ